MIENSVTAQTCHDSPIYFHKSAERARLLESAVEFSKEAVLITTAQLALPGPITVFANRAFERMSGYSVSELIGKTPRILQGAKTDRRVLNEMHRHLSEGTEFLGETVNYRRDGSEYTFEWSVAPIKNQADAITHFVAVQKDVTARKESEEQLIRIRQAVESSSDAVGIADMQGKSIYHNPAFVELLGYTPHELNLLNDSIALCVNGRTGRKLAKTMTVGGKWRGEVEVRGKSGEIMMVDLTANPVRNEQNELIGIGVDIRQRMELEEQFRQSQKMESVGRLAGSVAHDFNNLLTIITGYSDLLRRIDETDQLHRNVREIRKAADRAAELTQQLLAFSRKQVQELKIINLNAVVANVRAMFERLLGEEIELTVVLAPMLGQVKADAGQIEQILMNLVVNARDAMPDGGRIAIVTENVLLTDDDANKQIGVPAGSFVALSVSDTGAGMSREVLERIFEPFFTTKEVGKGTGLGLSTVYGIVKQSNGFVCADSFVGAGSVFKIYLPRISESDQTEFSNREILTSKIDDSSEINSRGEHSPRFTETVLIVEDEMIVRKLAKHILETNGYQVLEAAADSEAVEICEQPENSIDLLLTDVVMPRLNGWRLVEQIANLRPQLKVLFMSGYAAEEVVRRGVSADNMNFLAKPFSPDQLINKVCEIIG